MTDALTVRAPEQHAPLPRNHYTIALLTHCAETGALSAERLHEIRAALHSAVAERAAAFTKEKSTTVTVRQAEGFYASVLCQADACLLAAETDAQAVAVLREQPFSAILEQGQLRTLELYEQSKAYFRRAYELTRPFETSFFRGLLTGFARYCTRYDARFRADDTGIDAQYPPACDRHFEESGTVGVYLYYRTLMTEGELLSCFDRAGLLCMLDAYADKYLTSRENIAENLCELALRHWLTAAAARGDSTLTVRVTQEDIAQLSAECAYTAPEQLAKRLAGLPEMLAGSRAAQDYLRGLLPDLTAQLHRRAAGGTLTGWVGVQE